VRSDDPVLFPESEYPDKLVDSTSATDSPDLELFTTPLAYRVCCGVLVNIPVHYILMFYFLSIFSLFK
jgi:hypothetical protein